MADSDQIAAWLAATATGDQRAFQKLYNATSGHLFALLLRILVTRETAEDALQDVYVRIWQKADTYKPGRGAPLSWLLSIARYRALDLLRRQRPEQAMPANPEVQALWLEDLEAPGPLQRSETMQALSTVHRCLQTLRADQRHGLMLAYYEGLTHQEVSERLGIPLGTAKSLIRRGLKSLQACLDNK